MTSKYLLDYIICPECKNVLAMSFADIECPNPLCKFNFKGLLALLEKNDNETRNLLLKATREGNKREIKLLATAIKANMIEYLIHFIKCSWGSHYNAIFKDFLLLYLDDLNALQLVLKSDEIQIKNAEISKNGYRIFWDLYRYLMKVNNSNIRRFLLLEFPKMHKRWTREKRKSPLLKGRGLSRQSRLI